MDEGGAKPPAAAPMDLLQGRVAGLLAAAARWRIGLVQGQLIALTASLLIAAARWAASPLVGEEVSFVSGAPLVMLAAFFGGRLAGATTILLGSALALAVASAGHWQAVSEGLPRLMLWLLSATVLMLIAVELRAALRRLQVREDELVRADARTRLLMRELEHRGRNALAIVQAMSNDIARTAASVQDYQALMGGRLRALGLSYSALTADRSTPVELRHVVLESLKPFGDQIDLAEGPDVMLDPQSGLSLAMALHELATNATKYGALSTPSGAVRLTWRRDAGRAELTWSERGGPPPKAAAGRGFGSELLRALFQAPPAGRIDVHASPHGVEVSLSLAAQPTATGAESP